MRSGCAEGQHNALERLLGEPGLQLAAQNALAKRGIAAPARHKQHTAQAPEPGLANEYPERLPGLFGVQAVKVKMILGAEMSFFQSVDDKLIQSDYMAFQIFIRGKSANSMLFPRFPQKLRISSTGDFFWAGLSAMERPLPSSGVTERMATRNSSSSVACGRMGSAGAAFCPAGGVWGFLSLAFLFLFAFAHSACRALGPGPGKRTSRAKPPGLGLSGTMRSMAAKKSS